jgi:cysteine-rich repeat protein
LRVAGETCDDGNKLDGIGCNANCLGNKTGYYCTGGSPTTIDVCITTCGDGIPVAPGE